MSAGDKAEAKNMAEKNGRQRSIMGNKAGGW